MYGGLVYASSNMRMRAAFLPAIAVSKPGTQLWIHASPDATELSCMLWPSLGVNQMKLVPTFNAARTSAELPECRFAHRAGLPVIVVYDRNGKWSSPRFGLMEQPEPLPSAIAFQVWPEVSIRYTNVGWFRVGWFLSPETPKVIAPRGALCFGWDCFVRLSQPCE